MLLNAAFDFRLNVVFNAGMTDSDLIKTLGGPTKVAKLLRLTGPGAVQRVQNWMTRGIPAQVKITHRSIFLDKQTPGHDEQAHTATEGAAT